MEASRIEEPELSKELCERLLTHFREQVGKVFKIGIIFVIPRVSHWPRCFFLLHRLNALKFQIFYADRIIFFRRNEVNVIEKVP